MSSIPGYLANQVTGEGDANESSPPRRTAEEERNVAEIAKPAGSVVPVKTKAEREAGYRAKGKFFTP